MAELPGHAIKIIFWHEGGGRAFILIGYCPDTLAYFQAMFAEAQKTFPDIRPEDVTCGKVSRSQSMYGFTLMAFDVPKTERREYVGWNSRDGAPNDIGY